MANKTTQTEASVEEFIDTIDHERKREEARELLALFERVTGERPKLWGPSIIGFGEYHYEYDSGREGDWMRTGFSPRKAKHSLYLMGGYCDEPATPTPENWPPVYDPARAAPLAALLEHILRECLAFARSAE